MTATVNPLDYPTVYLDAVAQANGARRCERSQLHFACDLTQRVLEAGIAKYPDLSPVTELEAARAAARARIQAKRLAAEAAGFTVAGQNRKLPLDRDSAAKMQVALSRAAGKPSKTHVVVTGLDGLPASLPKGEAAAIEAAYSAAFDAIEAAWLADTAAYDAATTVAQFDAVAV